MESRVSAIIYIVDKVNILAHLQSIQYLALCSL